MDLNMDLLYNYKNDSLQYELQSIYTGSLIFYYYAYCKNILDNKWRQYNDSQCMTL